MRPGLAALGLGLLIAAAFDTTTAASAPPTQSPATEPITLYHTRPGDTLLGLAARYMTSSKDAAIVQRLSGVADPFRMPVGSLLRIPTRLLKSTPVTLTVLAVTGAVSRTPASGAPTSLRKGDLVGEGDRISTAAHAFATLVQADGSRVSLPSQTTLRIAVLRRTLLESSSRGDLVIESGRGELSVTPLRSPSDRFEIRTPAAVAAVRGTEFRVAYDVAKSSSTLEVLHGRVGESAADEGPAVDIVTGMAAQRPLGGERRILPLPPAPALEPSPPVRKTPAFELRILDPHATWRYHVILARDEGFTDIFAETTTSDGVARFDEPAPGPISARITAIDENGIEGFPKVYTLLRLVPSRMPATGG